MTDFLFQLVADYGTVFLFAVTFLSCLAVPVPASLLMLSGGGFAASGDLGLWSAVSASYLGAVSGDQLGYMLGRHGSGAFRGFEGRHPKRAAAFQRARNLTLTWGGSGVFFSRWLLSPLGPYVNFASGAAGLHWGRYLAWGAAGEAIWVALYIGLGYGFASRVGEFADLLGSASGLLSALALTVGLGLWLRHALRHHKFRKPTTRDTKTDES